MLPEESTETLPLVLVMLFSPTHTVEPSGTVMAPDLSESSLDPRATKAASPVPVLV